MKDEHFVSSFFQYGFGFVYTGGGIAKHAGDDERLAAFLVDLGFDHSADGSGSSGENGSRDAIESAHVDDAGHHNDVFGADVVSGISAG